MITSHERLLKYYKYVNNNIYKQHSQNAKIGYFSIKLDCVIFEYYSMYSSIDITSLLNSVQSGNSKNSVMLDVNKQIKNSITITPFDILGALKNIKCGKSSGIDGISAEHFVFAHSRIHVLLSLLFSAFITHGYLPGMFMKTAIVLIIKNKTGDTSDKNNYRPIALATAASKIFELCLSVILENYLFTHDQQFGFKSKHSTDFCIYTVKSVSKYYTQHHSPVYT